MKLKDEPSIWKYLWSVLEAYGYHVKTVSNGKDAISNCRAWILQKLTLQVDLKCRGWKGRGKDNPPPVANREGWGTGTERNVGGNGANTSSLLVVIVTVSVATTPTGPTVAGPRALVGESRRCPGRRHRSLQCRLEMPLVAVLIENQSHHTPEVPG
jgi:hypothetical protein